MIGNRLRLAWPSESMQGSDPSADRAGTTNKQNWLGVVLITQTHNDDRFPPRKLSLPQERKRAETWVARM